MEKLSFVGKKGNVNLALVGVTTLMVAGFLFVMGLIMMDELYIEVSSTSYSVANESETTPPDNVTSAQCDRYARCGFNSFAIVAVTNNSGDMVFTSPNYTVVSSRECTWRLTDAGEADNLIADSDTLNVTYTYSSGEGTEACDATNATLTGQGKFGDYVDLIVLAVIITIIISLVIGGFAMRRTR